MYNYRLLFIYIVCLTVNPVLRGQTNKLEINKIEDLYYRYIIPDNFAAAPFLNNNIISLSFKNEFFLAELTKETLDFILPFRENSFHFQIAHDGYSRFGEMKMSLAYSRAFKKRFAVGMQFYYLMHHAKNYELMHSLGADISLYTQLFNAVWVGIQVVNPFRLKYDIAGTEVIPTKLCFVGFYKINKEVLVSLAVRKAMPGFLDTEFSLFFRKKSWGVISLFSLTKMGVNLVYSKNIFEISLGTDFYYLIGFSSSAKFSCFF